MEKKKKTEDHKMLADEIGKEQLKVLRKLRTWKNRKARRLSPTNTKQRRAALKLRSHVTLSQ